MERFLSSYGIEKIRKRRNEWMFIAQNVPRLPEIFPVGMLQFGHRDAPSALQAPGFSSIVETELVHLLESETHHPLRPVHLKSIPILAAHPITTRLERANAAIGKARHHHARVVHVSIGGKGMHHRA